MPATPAAEGVRAARARLDARLRAGRDAHIAFLQGFLRCRSANPPGDCTSAASHVTDYLTAQGAPCRIVAAQPNLPNVVGTFAGVLPGRHLVLNGHIDVFPALDEDGWSGRIEGNRIMGRGAADMKAGTAAAVIAYALLHQERGHLPGRLTLTAVSDEQTGGRWGTRYLLETIPEEVTGDCLLNGEPSGLTNLRFMEKGTLRLVVTLRAPGGHGGYPHLSANPNKAMAALVQELDERFHGREAPLPEAVRRALTTPEAVRALDEGLGQGAAEWVRRMTFNPGVVQGGLKVNQIPHECRMEADFRLPVGLDRDAVLAEVAGVLGRHGAEWHVVEAHSYPPSMADPDGEMARIIQSNAQAATGIRPVPVSSLGGSDSRYWRYRGVPAYLYGPSPVSMGRGDEHVTVEEYLAVVRVHALSAFDYLTAAPSAGTAAAAVASPTSASA